MNTCEVVAVCSMRHVVADAWRHSQIGSVAVSFFHFTSENVKCAFWCCCCCRGCIIGKSKNARLECNKTKWPDKVVLQWWSKEVAKAIANSECGEHQRRRLKRRRRRRRGLLQSKHRHAHKCTNDLKLGANLNLLFYCETKNERRLAL